MLSVAKSAREHVRRRRFDFVDFLIVGGWLLSIGQTLFIAWYVGKHH